MKYAKDDVYEGWVPPRLDDYYCESEVKANANRAALHAAERKVLEACEDYLKHPTVGNEVRLAARTREWLALRDGRDG